MKNDGLWNSVFLKWVTDKVHKIKKIFDEDF